MGQRVTYYADQGSSATITAALSLRGAPLTPNSLTWTLTDDLGNVINSRKDVPLPAAASVVVVLSGADLAQLEPVDSFLRILTVNGKYTSVDGVDLTLAAQYVFGLNELVGSD